MSSESYDTVTKLKVYWAEKKLGEEGNNNIGKYRKAIGSKLCGMEVMYEDDPKIYTVWRQFDGPCDSEDTQTASLTFGKGERLEVLNITTNG